MSVSLGVLQLHWKEGGEKRIKLASSSRFSMVVSLVLEGGGNGIGGAFI